MILIIICQQYNIIQQETGMQKSRSHSQLQSFSRTASQRCFYINDQLTNSKDIATIFHSPYKDGKKNDNYINPTFVSSNLFYGDEQVKQVLMPKHNLIYNKNQRCRKQMYEKRMQKVDYLTNTVHLAAYADNMNRSQRKKVNDETGENDFAPVRSRSKVKLEKVEKLEKQLNILLNHRQKEDKKDMDFSRRVNTQISPAKNSRMTKIETPIYHQKNRFENEQKAISDNKKNLQQWMQISNRIRKIKQGVSQENKKIQVRAMDSFIVTNNYKNQTKELESRKNASMLANILRQQIKQSEAKKNREKKQRIGIY